MDSSSADGALISEPSPVSPLPLLALNEFIGRTTPSSLYTSPTTPASTPADAQSSRKPEDAALSPGPCSRSPAPVVGQPAAAAAAAAAPEDWLSQREQIVPTRHLGDKGLWIRGWSIQVAREGDGAYCACSDAASRCLQLLPLDGPSTMPAAHGAVVPTTTTAAARAPGTDRKSREKRRSRASPEKQAQAAVTAPPLPCSYCRRRLPAPTVPEAEAEAEAENTQDPSMAERFTARVRAIGRGIDRALRPRKSGLVRPSTERPLPAAKAAEDARKSSSDINPDNLSDSSGRRTGQAGRAAAGARLARAQNLLNQHRAKSSS
ncbi:hypothetical protein P8C59_004043 [Phyllachora maydis]|nr:hypothetical protein P8C59_004043 [Phyllachora maydis]